MDIFLTSTHFNHIFATQCKYVYYKTCDPVLRVASEKKCCLYIMFVKRKKNRWDSVTVVVVAKKDGKSYYLKTMGTSDNPVEIEDYCQQGKKWIENQLGMRDIFTEYARM
jgi:hypothetical protein